MTGKKRFFRLSLYMMLVMALMVAPVVSAESSNVSPDLSETDLTNQDLAKSDFTRPAITKPKTSAPPDLMQPFGMLTGYTYLLYQNITLEDTPGKANSVDITGVTYAKQVVSELGAKIQLERWTGSTWINSGTLADLSESNAEYFGATVTRAATAGYYYRAKVIHFAKQGTTTESVTVYSPTMLKS